MRKKERQALCSRHKKIGCGFHDQYVCDKCKKEGWLPQAAIGGPIHYIENRITGERKYKKEEEGDKILF